MITEGSLGKEEERFYLSVIGALVYQLGGAVIIHEHELLDAQGYEVVSIRNGDFRIYSLEIVKEGD